MPDTYEEHEDSYAERVEKLMTMTVAVAKGFVPSGQVVLPLTQIAHGSLAPPEIKEYTKILLQIIKGERNPQIGADLPPDLAQAVTETIRQIEAPIPEADNNVPKQEALTLTELLERIGEACLGDVSLWQDMWNFMDELENSPETPPDIKALALALTLAVAL